MSTALLVIDVQMAFVARREAGFVWGNPDADTSIATLLAAFRDKGLPVLHVHHNDPNPGDSFHADQPGSAVQPLAAPLADEAVFIKQGSSGFIGTGLADHLTAEDITGLVIVGGAANYCVESTARMAGNLGYATTVVGDALINFRQRLRDGREMAASDVLALTLANLDGEFAHIASVNEILTQVAS
ncbi:isochorismatase family protein [Cypionkella psychrotolerans]|uniref:isochorismatase family protein n=1 Tax=Cypionkella psychrotolerans TaxID=1678131 RepID=UPI0006B4B50D|nr:isochorismatase family protein [Cypionkella psychrotolerans]